MKITVKIYEKGDEILSKIFEEGAYRIGRSEQCDISLSSDLVSRSHVELRVTDSAVYLTNMSTSGKVKVNGKAVETAEVADGDEVALGPYRVVILHGAEEGGLEMPAGEDAGENADGAFEVSPPENDSGEPEGLEGGMPQSQIGIPEPEAGFEGGGAASAIAEPQRFEGTAALNRAETVVEAKPVVAKLVFTEGPRKGEEMFLEAYEVSLGRSKKADIFLDDDKLSRIHAKIARVGMGYRLIDMNSRNGTHVNGMRVLEHPLSSFDSIELGNCKIKFLIHDIVSSDMGRGGALANVGGTNPPVLESTKSLRMDAAVVQGLELDAPRVPSAERGEFVGAEPAATPPKPQMLKADAGKKQKFVRLALVGVLVIGAAMFLMPSTPTVAPVDQAKVEDVGRPQPPDTRVTPAMPKEFTELAPETQRAIEGYYSSAIRAADKEMYEDAIANLSKIHEVVPYYKQSSDLMDQYSRKLKEKQIQAAADKAQKVDTEDVGTLVDEGLQYLRDGDWERASETFNTAITLDPNNLTAIKGIKAAEMKIKDINRLPPERDPEGDKRDQVKVLFEKAVDAFSKNAYQSAIDFAEQIRAIELKGDTTYLTDAKKIIDRSRQAQKEEFEPFLLKAKEDFAEGNYKSSRDLCEEMLKQDPGYQEAKDCVLKAKKQLNRLAKEAYTYCYILDSMNRLEEAKQYCNRAKNHVQPGDDYYDKIMKKLETLQ